MRILVIGGSGLIGSRLVERLGRGGHDAVPASPSSGVDAASGRGLPQAMDGAEVVIDVTNPPSPDADAAADFFLKSAHNIAAAETAAGVVHHIALSVVGVDRLLDGGYFRAKRLQEDLLGYSGIPYTIVRSTQFFEFMTAIAGASTAGGMVRLPDFLVQPVAADDVAGALASTATAQPANRMIELAGPEPLRLGEAVGRVLAANGDQRTVTADPDALYFGVRLGELALMPGDGARLAPTTLDAWLARSRRATGR
jgi:uncharacterized protein YbjT (DUF2867 family)